LSTNWEEASWWIALVLGLLGTAAYSGVETGLYCLNRVRLRLRSTHGPRRRAARTIAREMEQPERVLAANLVANLICGDMAATAASRLMAMHGYGDLEIIAANVAIFTPVFFVFVESVPKEVFRIDADRATYRFAWLLPVTRRVLTWTLVLPCVRAIAGVATRLAGGGSEGGLESSARERVASLLRDSAGKGALSESQAGLVDRAMVFQRRTVGDEMQAWNDVAIMPEEGTLGQLREAIERSGSTYVALVASRGAGSRESGQRRAMVVGVVWHGDAYLRTGRSVRSMAAEPARLTARTPLPEAIALLKSAEAPVGIVEEGGRPIGLVGMDDLVEPLFAEKD
jgi:CBS domain containing-hemolysin-like protein